MDDKLAIFINDQVHMRFDNYLLPELSKIILHHLLSHPELTDKYFRDFITPDMIIKYMVMDSVSFIKKQIEFYKDKEYKIQVDQSGDECLESAYKFTTNALQSWQKDIYDVILNKMKDEFTLRQMYEYEDDFKKLHPNNNNIRPKIRQILQKIT